jgi:hypothetical protein
MAGVMDPSTALETERHFELVAELTYERAWP